MYAALPDAVRAGLSTRMLMRADGAAHYSAPGLRLRFVRAEGPRKLREKPAPVRRRHRRDYPAKCGSPDPNAVLPGVYCRVVHVESVAIIGSFRQRYEQVLEAWQTFSDAGMTVTSPLGSPVIEPGIPFVRFSSDNEEHSDAMVQTIALHRIMRADFTYVMAPDGYVGRTTCYEIGRLMQVPRPLYFSEEPDDLPIAVPASHVTQAAMLVDRFAGEPPVAWHLDAGADPHTQLEHDLLTGNLRSL